MGSLEFLLLRPLSSSGGERLERFASGRPDLVGWAGGMDTTGGNRLGLGGVV